MQTQLPLTRDLVLIGGGHAHALVLRMWGMHPLPGTRVTVINPGPTAPYSGMLPGHVAGHYTRDELDIDLVKLARFAGAAVVLGKAHMIDPVARTVTVGERVIAYDVASIDVGIHAEMPAIEGFAEHGTGAKPLDTYAARWRDFLARATAGEVPPEVAVIGGGVAGLELALAMAHALRRDVGRADVRVVEATGTIAPKNAPVRARLQAAMDALGVQAETRASVTRVTADAVELADGRSLPSRFTVGAAGAFAHPWLANTRLPLTEDGFIKVAPDLAVEGAEGLFAVGDCAHMTHAPRPKAGVFAVRVAPVLYDNLRAALSGGDTRVFRPQKDYLKLVSLGGKSALAEKWGRSFAGPLLWRWKNRIDQRFMDRFRYLPEMDGPEVPLTVTEGVREELGDEGQPLCGGCGSKLGPATLSGALRVLPRTGRADVLTGPGDDAAVLAMGDLRQVVTTDHLRAFTLDPVLMARITAVHALGDIWAMGAAPQAALVSLILPRMAPALQARRLEEVLTAANAVLREAGAEIVGGHSTMGSEMTLGFTLTGLAPEKPITQAGARPGDRLILTRPIGSGTLMAAEMQGKARGADIAAMFDIMQTPQGDAAKVLADAHAMTDVTGFGLVGHLRAICRASGVGAELVLDDIPIYDGALDLAEQGIRSTIHAANMFDAPVGGPTGTRGVLLHDPQTGDGLLSAAPVGGATGARGVLLHDPQTAGGLLAAVAEDVAEERVAQLRALGHEAADIGWITGGVPAIACR